MDIDGKVSESDVEVWPFQGSEVTDMALISTYGLRRRRIELTQERGLSAFWLEGRRRKTLAS